MSMFLQVRSYGFCERNPGGVKKGITKNERKRFTEKDRGFFSRRKLG